MMLVQNLDVIFCLDRAGFVGADGGLIMEFMIYRILDIPNMIVSPMNEQELRNLMYKPASNKGPFSIRYPRGKGVMIDWRTPLKRLKLGKGEK